jgi:phenylpyruvate tautomerase PptA (4-oxalocrotonate tautomerase family)
LPVVTVTPAEPLSPEVTKQLTTDITAAVASQRHVPADAVTIFFSEDVEPEPRIQILMLTPYSANDAQLHHSLRRVVGDLLGGPPQISVPNFTPDRIARGGHLQRADV